MLNTGNRPPRRKPGSRPRGYREIYTPNQPAPTTTPGITSLLGETHRTNTHSAGQLHVSQCHSDTSDRFQATRTTTTASGGDTHVRSSSQLATRSSGIITKTRGRGATSVSPPSTGRILERTTRPQNQAKPKIQSESRVGALNNQQHARKEQRVRPTLPPRAAAAPAPPVEDNETDSEWHESVPNLSELDTIAENPLESTGATSQSAGEPYTEQKAEDQPKICFDLREAYLSIQDTNDDNANDTDEEEAIFGKIPYEKRIRDPDNIFKVADTIVFSPYHLPSGTSKGQDGDQSCTGLFEGTILIENTSKFNMTYQVKTSSLAMFRVSEPFGFIYPETKKAIVVRTNPKMQYTFDEISDSSFVVLGHPLLYRHELMLEKVDAFWRGVESSILSPPNMEIHHIKWVRPKFDHILTSYSMIDRLRFISFRGNTVKVEDPSLPSIDHKTMNDMLKTSDPQDEILTLKFKNRQLSRALSRDRVKFQERNDLMSNLFASYGMLLTTYAVLGVLLYLDYIDMKMVEEPEVIPDNSWWRSTLSFITGGVSYAYNTSTGGILFVVGRGWLW